MAEYEYKPKTSQDAVAPHLDPLADEDAKRAEKAGVKENYQSRPDVETLAARRAREGGWKFEDAAFRRSAEKDELTGGGVVTSDDATSKEAEQKPAARKASK